ncbi:MAG: autotransporter-associated beta strand repeat-containing protein [Chlamydiales bacterium]|nr:autotransporter-associated beta strand repeat-containing protein [Chlamydiales bacterium]
MMNKLVWIVALIANATLLLTVDATSYTWKTDGTINWNTPSNWTPSGLPDGSDSALIPGKGAQPVIIQSGNLLQINDIQFKSDLPILTVASTGGMLINDCVSGTGIVLIEDGGYLTFDNNATSAATDGSVITYQVGSGGGDLFFGAPMDNAGTANMVTTIGNPGLLVIDGNVNLGKVIMVNPNDSIFLNPGKTLILQSGDSLFAGDANKGGGINRSGDIAFSDPESSLTLSGNNNKWSGSTTLSAGSIKLAHNSGLGKGSLLMKDATTLHLSDAVSTPNNITLNGTCAIQVTNNGIATLSGVISDDENATGALIQQGSGVLVLNGANTYSGGTTIHAGGTIRASENGNFGNNSGALNLAGGTLQYGKPFNLSSGRNIVTSSNLSKIDTNGHDVIVVSSIQGKGGITKEGSGTLTLTNSNTYTEGTSIHAGTLKLSEAGSLHSKGAVSLFSSGSFDISTVNSSQPIMIGNLSSNSSNTNVILGNHALTFGAEDNTTFNGLISGTGNLKKQGKGTFTLNNANGNNYSGIVTISEGTFQAGVHGAFSNSSLYHLEDNESAVLDLNNTNQTISMLSGGGSKGGLVSLEAGTLTLLGGPSTTYSGTITGSGGSLIKRGPGSLTLNNMHTHSGATIISEGTFIVNGSMQNSLLTIGPNATLKGNGTFGKVNIHGTVSPGNSIGTISGTDFTFLSGSSLNNEINASGDTDLIAATGDITIDPNVTLNVIAEPGTYTSGETYTFATAGGSIAGEFTTINSTIPRLNPQVTYNSQSLMLTLLNETFFSFLNLQPDYTATTNAISVANYLDYLENSGDIVAGSDLASVLTVATAATASQLSSGLNTFHPAPYNTLLVAQEESMVNMQSTLVDRLDKIYLLCPQICCFNEWITPVGSFAHFDSTYETSGYESSMGGVAGGIDLFVNKNLCTGFTAGYTQTAVNWDSPDGNGNIKTGYAGLYSRLFNRQFYVDASAITGIGCFRGTRPIFLTSSAGTVNRVAQGKFYGVEVDTHVGVGTIVNTAPVDINIFSTLDWVYTHQNSFTEKNANSLDLSVKGKNCNLLRPALGFTLFKRMDNWTPEIGVTGAYYGRLDGRRCASNFVDEPGYFVTHGLYPSEMRVIPRFRITGLFPDNRATCQASYEGEFSHDYFEHSFTLNFGYCF